MDRPNKLGGAEMMYHRAAAGPETQVEGEKAKEVRKLTTVGGGGKWLRENDKS